MSGDLVDEGMAHLREGRWGQGAESLKSALAQQPDFAELWGNLGYALKQLGRVDEARKAIAHALRLKPGLADSWNLLGLVEQDEGHYEAAHDAFTRAIALQPDFAYAWMNRANCDFQRGQREQALQGYARSLAIDPNHPDTHFNLAHVLQSGGEVEAAIAQYREALRLRPAYANAHIGLAAALRLGGHPGALAHCFEALRADPTSATCHRLLCNELFREGRFDEAWQEYGWRRSRQLHVEALARRGIDYRVPRLDEMAGRRIAILGEQGLGDTLFFLRFAPLLRARHALLDFVGDGRLHGMLERTGLFSSLSEDAAGQASRADFEVLAGDLAMLSQEPGRLETPPALRLEAESSRLERARERLRALGPAPYIALVWRAGAPREGFERLVKEIPPGVLGECLRGIGATWVAVQRELGRGEIAAISNSLGRPVHDLSDVNLDLDDSLAMMAAVDDYVGVSNTNVHLRAGVSTSAHILVPFPPEWRWMARGRSPWFPTFEVCRQDRAEGWSPPLDRLADELRRQLPKPRTTSG